jgi:uncharacterized protein YqeY
MAASSLRPRLRAALTAAMKARDPTAVAALRSALAAIDNAEAVDPAHTPAVGLGAGPIAKAVTGLGAGEVARRQLTAHEEAAVVAAEVAERRSAAAEYDHLGRADDASRLRAEADVLAAQLDTH